MSHEKSFSKYINNSISKRQIVIHQTAFFYGKLLSSFLSGPSEIFKIKGTDSFFFMFGVIKVASTWKRVASETVSRLRFWRTLNAWHHDLSFVS